MPSTNKFTKDRLKESYSFFPRAVRELFRNQGFDGAASLAYYMVLAMFPGLLALVSLLTLIGASESGTEWMLEILRLALTPRGEVPGNDAQQLLDTAEQLLAGLAANASGTTFAIFVGSLGALWSTSGYVTAFGRCMNRLYGAVEGRPQWKRRAQMLLITFAVVVLAVVSMVLLATSGSVARGIGNLFGLGDSFVTILNWSKPPILLIVVLLVLAMLYYFTPNVKRAKFQWFSPGTVTAVIILGLSVVGFSFYLANFASYSATYGAIGGVIVLVLACWISNIALIFGALVDIEFVRLRQLRTGMSAAEEVQLPLRDSRMIAKKNLSIYKDLVQAQDIRIKHNGDPLQDMRVDPAAKINRKTKVLPIVVVAALTWIVTSRLGNSKLRKSLKHAQQTVHAPEQTTDS